MFMKKLVTFVGMVAMAVMVQATDRYKFDTANGTANLGSGTQINATGKADRLVIYQGTVNLNEGASIIVGGDTSSCCNFIGVQGTTPAALNVNGGTFRCSAEKGGAGYLRLCVQRDQVATLTINSGSVTVDKELWTGTYFNNSEGWPNSARGVINVNGGALNVGTLHMGADKGTDTDGSGSTEVYLAGGVLSVKSIDFRSWNNQVFQFANGTLKALQANVFNTSRAYSGNTGGRTIEVVGGTTSVFDNDGFDQMLPPLTGTGTLRLQGNGAFSFAETSLSYNLALDGTTLKLGTVDAATPLLTLGGSLAILSETVVSLTIPGGATGRYPVFANCGTLNAQDVETRLRSSQGEFVLEEGTVYLVVADEALVYFDPAGGDDVPVASAFTYLSFLPTAGAFNVNAPTLGLSDAVNAIRTTSSATQTVSSAVTFVNANAGIFTETNATIVLKGGLTALSPVKRGCGTLVLDNATTFPSTLVVEEGTVDFAERTYQGKLQFPGNGVGRTVTLRNGTWKNGEDWSLNGYNIHFGEGFNFEMQDMANGRIALGYLNPAPLNESNLTLDSGCGTVTLHGNDAGRCNFIGVSNDSASTGRVVVAGGRLHVERNGSSQGIIRLAAGTSGTVYGLLKVAGGELVVDSDLTLATVYNGLQGGKGMAEFELESGRASVRNFYLGGSTSTTGRGTVRLLGGDLFVNTFKCWGYCTQTLLCDGVTIHAMADKVDSGTPISLLTAVPGADGCVRSYTIGANGLTLDTAGYSATCEIPFTGGGALTVMGAGSLTYLGPSAFTGGIVVSNETSVTFADRRVFSSVTIGKNAKFGVKSAEGEDVMVTGATTFAEGAKIVVDVSALDCPQTIVDLGDVVLPDGTGLLDVLEVKDRTDMVRFVPTLAEGKIVLIYDLMQPYFAVWTGGGVVTNARDPENWSCSDAFGQPMEGKVPNEYTTVRLTNETLFNVPADQPITVAAIMAQGPLELVQDCDWRGLGVYSSSSQNLTIRLNGHSLFLSDLNVARVIENTDPANPPAADVLTGELHVDVPEGETCTNLSLTVNGQVKFVKDGAGVFVAAKTDQSYSGGSRIVDGTVKLGVSMAQGTMGADGTDIQIDANGFLDSNSTFDNTGHLIVLNGGTLGNTGPTIANAYTRSHYGDVKLLTNSVMDFTVGGLVGAGAHSNGFDKVTLDLNGHTLTLRSSSNQCWMNNVEVTAGRLVVEGYLTIPDSNKKNPGFFADHATIEMKGTLTVGPLPGVIRMGAYINDNASSVEPVDYNVVKPLIEVFTCFRPKSSRFWGVQLQDGCTLDLSDQTEVWIPKSTLAVASAPKGVEFADGATITIDVGRRYLRNGDQLVVWDETTRPKNLKGLHFKLADGRMAELLVGDGGIVYSTGLLIILR